MNRACTIYPNAVFVICCMGLGALNVFGEKKPNKHQTNKPTNKPQQKPSNKHKKTTHTQENKKEMSIFIFSEGDLPDEIVGKRGNRGRSSCGSFYSGVTARELRIGA